MHGTQNERRFAPRKIEMKKINKRTTRREKKRANDKGEGGPGSGRGGPEKENDDN